MMTVDDDYLYQKVHADIKQPSNNRWVDPWLWAELLGGSNTYEPGPVFFKSLKAHHLLLTPPLEFLSPPGPN